MHVSVGRMCEKFTETDVGFRHTHTQTGVVGLYKVSGRITALVQKLFNPVRTQTAESSASHCVSGPDLQWQQRDSSWVGCFEF